MAYAIKNHQKLAQKAAAHQVTHLGGTYFQVVSSTSGEVYEVDVWNDTDTSGFPIPSCQCARQAFISDEMNGGINGCSHVMAAVRMWVAMNTGESIIPRPDDPAILRQLKRKKVALFNGDNVAFTARPAVWAQRELTGAHNSSAFVHPLPTGTGREKLSKELSNLDTFNEFVFG